MMKNEGYCICILVFLNDYLKQLHTIFTKELKVNISGIFLGTFTSILTVGNSIFHLGIRPSSSIRTTQLAAPLVPVFFYYHRIGSSLAKLEHGSGTLCDINSGTNITNSRHTCHASSVGLSTPSVVGGHIDLLLLLLHRILYL